MTKEWEDSNSLEVAVKDFVAAQNVVAAGSVFALLEFWFIEVIVEL